METRQRQAAAPTALRPSLSQDGPTPEGEIRPDDGHDAGNAVAMASMAKAEAPAGSSAQMVAAETKPEARRLGWHRP